MFIEPSDKLCLYEFSFVEFSLHCEIIAHGSASCVTLYTSSFSGEKNHSDDVKATKTNRIHLVLQG